MQVWSVPSSPAVSAGTTLRTAPDPTAAQTIAGLIDGLARDNFATRTVAELNRTLPIAWWTVTRTRHAEAPRLCLQASHGVRDITLDCWEIYRNGVYRDDAPFAEACDRVAGAATPAVVTHCGPEDFCTAHRERIYVAHSLAERISLVSAERVAERAPDDGDAVLAINLYRHRAQARFDAQEIDTVLALAAPLIALVRRHLQLREPAADRLRTLCEALTPRELEVCDRLLRGLSFDGIAADLGLSATTVKTYRNRAFERLGIHHRNELFGLLWRRGLPG